jgi:hypothetical protein
MSIHEYKSEPCPICGHKGWCGLSDEDLILCKRPPSPPEVAGYIYKGVAKDGTTAMYVEAAKQRRQLGGPPPVRRERHDESPILPGALEVAHAAAVAAMTAELRTAVAAELGLPEAVLAELAIGWSDTARHHAAREITGAYIFPEYDGQGRLIGVSYRFPATKVAGLTDDDGRPIGNKSSPAGCKRGLTLPLAWREMPDPTLIVEGPTDVLAARALGLSAVGRPSNNGGADLVAQLCRQRRIIVVGENDRKPDGRWPGRDGAEAIVRRLEAQWQRPVPVAYPPEGVKDLRDWVRTLVPAWDTADLSAVRQAVLDAVQPPALLLLAQERDKRGRVTVKVFNRDDGVSAVALYSDRLHIEDAAARRRFARAVAKIVPGADVEDLACRLLAVPLPPDARQRVKALLDERPEDPQQRDAARPRQQDASITPAPPGDEHSVVFVPGGPAPILRSAVQLGGLLDKTGKYYIRGGMVTTVGKDKDGRPILETIKPAGLASVFETVAKIMEFTKREGQFVPQEAVFTEQAAKLVQHSAVFQALLPPIHLLSRCPVLIERGGAMIQVSGYDRDSGILAFGDPAPDVPVEDAVAMLSEMLADFHFATPADRSRALAAIITPAMVFGGLLGGRAPVDLGEADKSQTGKGYRAKLTAAVYNHIVKTVTQRKGGVGSLEESFATALVQGYNFISLDNVRSAIDSPALESFLTEDTFLARVPHLAAIEVDPRRVIVQLTSNRAEITTDLANRSACVRLLKQPEGYRFRKYPEGGLLEHIRANQPQYLAAVFAVVKAWHAEGKPMTDTSGHDFRAWAGKLDWIVQNVLGASPLLEGHRETQIRMATPVLNWLRDVALAVRNSGRLGLWLRANDLADIVAERAEAQMPGLPEGADFTDEEIKKKVLQALGRRMAQCFGAASVRTIDTFRIERKETADTVNRRTTREYRFELLEPAAAGCAYAPDAPMAHRRTIGADAPDIAAGTHEPALLAAPELAEHAGCAYAAPMGAPIAAPKKTLCAPIAPMGSEIAQRNNSKTHASGEVHVFASWNREESGTHRRIGAIGAEPPPPAGPTAEPDEVLI